jgi:hypothetical protein
MPELRDATVTIGVPGLNGTGLTGGEKTTINNRLDALEALTPPVNITDLADVDLSGIATGDLLQYDGTDIVPYTPAAIVVPFVLPFILDGGSSTIATGVWYDTGILINFAATITGWHVQATETRGSTDACDLVVTVLKATTGAPTTWTAISGTEKPTLSNQSTNSDTSLSTWTTALSSFDRLRVSVDSGTAKFATVSILCTREVGP